jgi:hypothetical protein
MPSRRSHRPLGEDRRSGDHRDEVEGDPVVALLPLAGLAAVPRADGDGQLDGASGWQRFERVLLPAIRPVLLVVLLTGR